MPTVANIGPRGQRMRRMVGVAALLGAASLLTALWRTSLSSWWTLTGFPILWFGMLGVLQARARTCVALAAERTCDGEIGRLTEADLETLARRGRSILVQATIAAAGITLAALLAFSYR